MSRILVALAALGLFAAAGPDAHDDPAAAFEIHPGFTIELVAREPVVLDPVDIEFDELGRVFVLEMPGYPFSRDPGRVVLLRDDDGDGVYERRAVFAEGLAGTADSILAHRGGLLVASPPDLIFLADEDGDGRADTRRVVLSGFESGNPQHNFNGLIHGLDNWIYGVNGGNSGSEVYWPEDPGHTVPLYDDDFRFDLERHRFERTGESAGGFGLTVDQWGRSFSTHNTEHVSYSVFPGGALEHEPGSVRHTRDYISDHESDGPARVYPIGVQQTRVNHPEQSGHFSGACGVTAYTGGAFGPDLEDNLFVADVVLNLVHRDLVRPAGASLVASRARPRTEFLASRDRSFRPVNMAVGPDGALYLLDMHRDVIEHPEWIPDEIEVTLDLDAGKDEGRVYRIAPRAGLPRARPRLDRSRPEALVEMLGHPNKWWRDTAQRLLVESGTTTVAPLLRRSLAAPEPRRRLHALWTLEGLGQLDTPLLVASLADAHPRVRENTLVVAEERIVEEPGLQDAVFGRAADPDERVRMQVALTLGRLEGTRAREALLAIATQDAEDRWTRLAVQAGLSRDPLAGLRGVLDRPALAQTPGGTELGRQLSARVPRAEVGRLLGVLAAAPDPPTPLVAAALSGVAEGLETAPGEGGDPRSPDVDLWLRSLVVEAVPELAAAAGRVARGLGLEPDPAETDRLRGALSSALDPARPVDERLRSLALVELLPLVDRRDALFALLGTAHPASLQRAAFHQLVRTDDDSVAPRLLGQWRELGRDVRAEAGTLLLRRRAHHDALLSAIEGGTVTLGELNLDLERRRALLRSPDAGIRARAKALFSDAGVLTRAAALAAMRPALELAGRPGAGHAVFEGLCARCHRVAGEGTDLGPDLTEISRKSAQTLLHEIVDPNAAIEARFVGYTVETRDGRVLSGIIVDEANDRLSVREAGGRDTEVMRRDIERMWTDGLSAMLEQLEAGMDPQAMADLLAFLQQPR